MIRGVGGPEPERIDPVCGMTVDVGPQSNPLEVGDETYYFCCPGCREAFASEQGVS